MLIAIAAAVTALNLKYFETRFWHASNHRLKNKDEPFSDTNTSLQFIFKYLCFMVFIILQNEQKNCNFQQKFSEKYSNYDISLLSYADRKFKKNQLCHWRYMTTFFAFETWKT